jgi:uncharacterized protein (TIGR03437 family)
VNVLIPAGVAVGSAQVTVIRSDSVTASGSAQVTITAPGLFSANANGTGVAAATAVRISPDGTRTNVPVFKCTGPCVSVPINLAAPGQVYLSLYATGVRNNIAGTTVRIAGVAAEVSYAGPQGQYAGLDQINVLVPSALRGRGEVDVVVEQGASRSNTVSVAVE